MSLPMNTTFSIENVINPETGKIFGKKYSGTFAIRRPSLLDKKNIALKDITGLSLYGSVDASMLDATMRLANYCFAFVTTVATEPLPEWFDMATMFEQEDVEAVLAVWEETGKFLDTFRPKQDGGAGSDRSDQPSLLVPEQV